MKKIIYNSIFALIGISIISACGGSSTESFVKKSVPGIAELGRLAGATVNIYELNGKEKIKKWTDITSGDKESKLDEIGIFNTHSAEMNINKIYIFEVIGGVDWDTDDNGVKNEIGILNNGSFRAVTKGEWCYTCKGEAIRISYVNEIQYRMLEEKINSGILTEQDMIESSKKILKKDIDNDKKIDGRDILLYNPIHIEEHLREEVVSTVPALISSIMDEAVDSIVENVTPHVEVNSTTVPVKEEQNVTSPVKEEPNRVVVSSGHSNGISPLELLKSITSGVPVRDITSQELNSIAGINNANLSTNYTVDLTPGEDPIVVDNNILTLDEATIEKDSDPKPKYIDPHNPTVAEVQAIIDARNAGVVSLPSIGGVYNEIVTIYEGDDIELLGNESYDMDGGDIANYRWIRACSGGSVHGWKEIANSPDSIDIHDIAPVGARYCIYRLIVTDEETGRVDRNRDGFKERRVLRVKIEPAIPENERPVALATANGENRPMWREIGIGDTVELDATGSYDGETSKTSDSDIVLYEWFRVTTAGGPRGWQKIGEGKTFVDELPVATRRSIARYYVKVSDADNHIDTSINGYKERAYLNFRMDPDSEINRKPIGILRFQKDGKLFGSLRILNVDAGKPIMLDATRSRDKEGIVKYTFEKSEDGSQTWSEITECIDISEAICQDTPSATLTYPNNFWSQTRYRVKVKDADNNEDYSAARVVNVRTAIVDTVKPVGRITVGGAITKYLRLDGETEALTIDVSKSSDNIEVVNYKIEKSNDNKVTWELLSNGSETSIEDTPNSDNSYLNQFWSVTWYKVTVYDKAGLESNVKYARAYVRKATEDTTKPVGRITVGGATTKYLRLDGETEALTIDVSASSDNVEVVNYKIEKSNDNKATWELLSNGSASTIDDTPNADNSYLNQFWSVTWYKVTVYDNAGLESSVKYARAYVRTAKEDTTNPVGRVQIDGAYSKEIDNGGESEEITLDATLASDNSDVIVSYTFMKSEDNKQSYSEIAGCVEITETTCKDTPTTTAYGVAGNQARTWYKVVVTDGAGLVSTNSSAQTYVDVVKPVTDTKKPTAKLVIENFKNGDTAPTNIEGTNIGREIVLDASTSSDDVGIVKYKFFKNETSAQAADFVLMTECDTTKSICLYVPSKNTTFPATGNWARTYFKVQVTDAAGNVSNLSGQKYRQVRREQKGK